jgi:HAE1 family hydrophobic/amphiphilic exporter-1
VLVPSLTDNVYAQIGLITLIGLAAKNAILIVEFAKVRVDRGEDLLEIHAEAVSLRLRPIIMTSLAFILGVLPLVFATGAGAVARRTIGFHRIGRYACGIYHSHIYGAGTVRAHHPCGSMVRRNWNT